MPRRLSFVEESLRPAMNPSRTPSLLFLTLLLPALAACDQIAVLDGSKAREADAVAVGSACRHAGRALEDCFAMYPDSPKAPVFSGWKEMNDYMTSNKIEVVPPSLVKTEVKAEGRDGKEGKSDKPRAKIQGLPSTSDAASDPLAGVTKAANSAASAASLEKVGTKPAPEAAAGKH